MKLKHNFLKHPAILSAAKLACAAGVAAALFGTCVPAVPVSDDGGHLPVFSGTEMTQDGTEEIGDGQGISPQNDEKDYNTPKN